MKTTVPYGLVDMDDEDLKDLLDEQIPVIDETETDDAGLDLAELDADEEYGDVDGDAKLHARAIVLLEQDVKLAKMKLSNERTAHDVAQKKYNQIGVARHTSNDARTIALRDAAADILDKADEALLAEVTPIMDDLRRLSRVTAKPREDSLSDDDFQRASARKAFVMEDCSDLPIGSLIRKIQNSLATGDVPSLWLYQRYASERVANPRENERSLLNQREVLKKLVESVADRFLDKRTVEINANAKALLKEARELANRVHDRRRELLKANPAAADIRYQMM